MAKITVRSESQQTLQEITVRIASSGIEDLLNEKERLSIALRAYLPEECKLTLLGGYDKSKKEYYALLIFQYPQRVEKELRRGLEEYSEKFGLKIPI